MVRAVPAGRAVVTTENKDNTAKGRKQLLANYKSMTAKIGRMSKQAALAAGAIGAPLVLAVKKFAEAGDKLDKMSDRTKISVESLSELQFAAEQTGTSIDDLSSSMFRATRRIGNAAMGTGPAVRALESLGLNAEDLSKLKPEKQLYVLIDALNGVGNEAQRSQFGFEVFGDQWKSIKPLIDSGTLSINELRNEAKSLGIVMTTEQASAAAELNDKMSKLSNQFKQVVVDVGGALAPALIQAAEEMQPLIKQVVEWIRNNPNLIKGIGITAASLGGLSVVLKAINIIMMANPFMLIVVGLTAAIPLVDQLNKRLGNTKEELAGIGGAFGPAEKDVIGARGQAGNARKQFEDSKKFIKAANQRRLQDPREQARLQQVFFKNLNHVAKRFKEVGDTMQKGIDKADRAKAFETASSQATSMAKDAVGRFGEVFKRGIGAAGTAIGLAAEFGQGQQLANQATQTISGGLGASALGIVRQQGARQMDQLVESNQRQEELSRRLLDEISGMRDELG